MQDKCFNRYEMLKWINYGIFHAFISYLLNFFVITGDGSRWASPSMPDGKDNGLWVAGHVVYTSTVLVANWVCVHLFHIHHWKGVGLIALMVFDNFFFLWLESEWYEPTIFADIYGTFWPTYTQVLTWLSLFLILSQVTIFETVSQQIKYFKEEKNLQEFIRNKSINSQKLGRKSLNSS